MIVAAAEKRNPPFMTVDYQRHHRVRWHERGLHQPPLVDRKHGTVRRQQPATRYRRPAARAFACRNDHAVYQRLRREAFEKRFATSPSHCVPHDDRMSRRSANPRATVNAPHVLG